MTDALDLDALEAKLRAALALVDETWGEVIPSFPENAWGDAACDILAAAPALIALARRVQQDAAREGTHAPDCHLWGRRHYDCLLGKYEASRAEIARLRQALEAAG